MDEIHNNSNTTILVSIRPHGNRKGEGKEKAFDREGGPTDQQVCFLDLYPI